jgi:hypothetical protein
VASSDERVVLVEVRVILSPPVATAVVKEKPFDF